MGDFFLSMQAQATAKPPQQNTIRRIGMRMRRTTPPAMMPMRALVARPKEADVEAELAVNVHWLPLREQEEPESKVTPGGLIKMHSPVRL